MLDNSKVTVDNNVWFYYGKAVVGKISKYIFSGRGSASMKFYNKPIHKEVYMYGVAYEQDSFQCMLDYALEVAGINKDPSFDIISQKGEKLCLAAGHPKKTTIEKVLNADRSLLDTYRRIEKHYARISIFIRGERKIGRDFSIKVSNEGYSIIVR